VTIADLLQSAHFVVDTEGKHQAVQLDMAHWQELVKRLRDLEAWEETWQKPFDAIRTAWETSAPAPDEALIPDDETLVDLVHQLRDKID
jgi:hypothetical protein